MIQTAVVLCGGLGSRVQHLFPELPKSLFPVLGKPFLHWLLMWLFKQSVRRIILAAGHKGESIRVRIPDFEDEMPVRISILVEDEPLGRGGALLRCLPHVREERLLVVNGDTSTLLDLDLLEDLFLDSDEPAYVLQTEDRGQVKGAGVYLFRRDALARFPCSWKCDLDEDLLPELKPRFVLVDVPFLDIGTPNGYARADKFVSNHRGCFGHAFV